MLICCLSATLKSIDYNVAMTFILNNNNNNNKNPSMTIISPPLLSAYVSGV